MMDKHTITPPAGLAERILTAMLAGLLACTALTTVSTAHAAETVPEHVIETQDVPLDHRAFILDTSKTRLDSVRFDTHWTTTRDEAGGPLYWPTGKDASLTIPDAGSWAGRTVMMRLALDAYNGCNVGQLNRFDEHGLIVGDNLFWINTQYVDADVPAATRNALGSIDTSRRVGCTWKAAFTFDDGTSVPDTFKGVTGFNDLDGWEAQPDLPFEGVQLGDGFDGAYHVKDAELAHYGVNGYAGSTHDAGDESDLNSVQQSKHRLAATWTGPTFTFTYDLKNPAGRTDGCHMTFGTPITRLYPLTYDPNGGTGTLPK